MMACFFFFLILITLYKVENFNPLKQYILLALFGGFLIDGIYSINRKYHCVKIGYNIPTFINIMYFIAFLILYIYLFFYQKIVDINYY
jgi:hypothetical protein